MAKSTKRLEQMLNNPRDWRMEDLEIIANRYEIDIRKSGGSHVVFSHAK
jgi:hypothetical protein